MTRRELLASIAIGATGLVDNPAHRAAYLHEMLETLTAAGPRPAGSEACEAGIRVIEREMRRSLPAVSLDSLVFRRWEPAGAAEFEVAGRKFETYIAENSPGTPPEGVRGTLHKTGALYEIVEPVHGWVVARAGISEFGRAVSSLHSGNDEVPLFNIGRQDRAALDNAVAQRLQARASAAVRWFPGSKTSSVIGTLPGASKDEILVVAHADTKYNTPGANDNTASAIAMLMLAHAVSGSRPPKTLGFLASTGEERGYIGARHYAQTRKENGTLGDVRVCINLDSLTYGPNLQIATTDLTLARLILDIHRDLKLPSAPKVLNHDDPMDSAPFHAAGARTVHLNSRGDDERTLPLWHRPEDTAATVKAEFVESSFRVLKELVSRLAAAPR